jgi:hypothetical protein
MERPRIDVQKIADHITKQGNYQRSKLPKETADQYLARVALEYKNKLVYPVKRSFFGIPVYDYIPNQERPDGWSIGIHKWNKGITFSYRCPVLKVEQKLVFIEDINGSIQPVQYFDSEKPSFWQRRFPKHFTFTIAKLVGKWRVTRAYCPFMEASLANIPVISKEEWDALGSDRIKIYEKGELQ